MLIMPKKTTWEQYDSRPLKSGGHSVGDNAPQQVVIVSESGTPIRVERGSAEHEEFKQRQLARAAATNEALSDNK